MIDISTLMIFNTLCFPNGFVLFSVFSYIPIQVDTNTTTKVVISFHLLSFLNGNV